MLESLMRKLQDIKNSLSDQTRRDRLFNEACAFEEAKEYKNAFPLMKEAADLGNVQATVRTGLMSLKGQGTEVSWWQAADYLGRVTGREGYKVDFHLGMIYGIGGYGLVRDHLKAEYHLNLATQNDGDSDAEEMLAQLRKKKPPFGGKPIARPNIRWK